MNPCPPTRVLETFAAGGCAEDAVGAHIEGCAECRAAVEECHENDRFLAGVRTALAAHEVKGSSEAGPESISPDLVLGYQIQEELHRGGQGVVYRAVQTRTRRTVAIKMLLGGHRATGRQRERFEREIRIAAGLRHPNIVTVYESGAISNGRYGLVMEYIAGVPLDRWSRSLDGARGREARRGALRERLNVMVKVCDAVLCAHQHSIVHRDLKPANILVDASGEPHILDFGIARDIGPLQHTRLTHTGEFAGTLAYASPEQVCGDLSKVDTRTDIYSLGVIMYELVSGKMPYAVDGPMSQTLRSIESAEPVPLRRLTQDPEGPWVDGEASTIILKAMAKDPARRYQTAAGLRNDLTRYLAGEAIEARRDSTWYMVRKTAARHRVVVAAAGLIFVLLAAFGGAMALQARRLEVRGRELAGALSTSTVDRGRALAMAGDFPVAEETVWPELIRAGVTRINSPEAGFVGSPAALHAYWAMWDIFRKSSHPATLHTHGQGGSLLYFDKTGQRLSVFDGDGRLVSWSVATWEPVRDTRLVEPPAEGQGFSAALAPGGSIAVIGGGSIRIINPETGRVEAQVAATDDQACTAAFSPDGTLLATIGDDNQLRLREARALATVVTIAEGAVGSGPSAGYFQPAFALDGGVVAAARTDGSVGLWNPASGVLERTLQPPDSLASFVRDGARAKKIAFGPDGTIVASFQTRLVVWPADGKAPLDLDAHCRTWTLAFLPRSEGRMLIASGFIPGGGAGVTHVWNLATGSRVATFGRPELGTVCDASPDGRLIAIGHVGGRVQVYEAAPALYVTILRPEIGRGSVAALSPDGRLLALIDAPDGATGRDVVLMGLKSGSTIARFHREGIGIRCLEFAPNGQSWFEGDASGRITQWDLPSGTAVREFAAPDPAGPDASEHRRPPIKTGVVMDRNGMRLSPDGSILARARYDGLIDLWDVPSGRWIGWLDSGATGLVFIDFSPDGRTLVADHIEKCVLWDVNSRQPKRTIAGNEIDPSAPFTPNASVRFSPDGAVIAHGAKGSIQFFDADTGRVHCENKVPGTAGLAMAFHPGGAVLFASAFDSSIRMWDTRTGRELLSLQKHTTAIVSLLLTPDGNTLISSDQSGMVLAWDLAHYSGHIRRELEYRAAQRANP